MPDNSNLRKKGFLLNHTAGLIHYGGRAQSNSMRQLAMLCPQSECSQPWMLFWCSAKSTAAFCFTQEPRLWVGAAYI